MNHRTITILLILPLAASRLGTSAMSEDKLRFNRDIRPILSDRCFLCHGPDSNQREADLRLDHADSALRPVAGGEGSHVLLPGHPEQSEAFLRITTDDDSLKMPPPESKLEITPDEIELIRKWIEQGAEYEGHWSFIPPVKIEPPAVQHSELIRNEIDRFTFHRMEEAGLAPNPPADRAKLLRRLSFDLTGLPPTLEELDRFIADDSEEMYERTVDRLLASERYGERMTADWLDVARYSDTYGYQVDRDRFVWPWRDWVIRAFNNNMPYDQFVTEQLAGDLLPNPTDDQILATTFSRLHPQKVEGGSVPEEFRIEYVADRTQTFGTAFLGLTLECCRCHDHKFDPFTQTEYYQLSAFFDKIDEFGLYSYFTPAIPTPTLLLSTDEQKAEIKRLQDEAAAAEQALAEIAKQQQTEFANWLETARRPEMFPSGEILHLDFEEVAGPNQKVAGIVGSAIELTGDDAVNTEVGNFQRAQPFSVALWMRTPDLKERAVVFHRSRAWTDAASRGYELLIEEGKLSAALIHFWPGNAIRVKTVEQVPVGKWVHVGITYDGSSRAQGLQIYVDGKPAESETVRDNLTKEITGGGGDNIAIGERFRDRGFKLGQVDQFRVYDRELTSNEMLFLAQTETSNEFDRRFSEDDLEYYLRIVNAEYIAQLKELQEKRQALNAYLEPISEIMVMRELAGAPPTHRLTRGQYDAPAEEVFAKTPASLSPLPADVPPNRLGLARWLTDPEHPLTSRVAVNRIWQMLFGQGLVRTPEDFGSQGVLPTHPDLLDWLAVDFVEHDWDLKRLVKLIVMSATYRESSTASEQARQIDPQNRLLSHAPTYRMPAEMLRDNALAVSGLLVNKIGGEPVKPYEIEVSFQPSKRDSGDALYRRSLYTYWKRTGPAPVMMTLDASKRDVCQVKREQTSSPLQAFVMLNGPQFVEASRGLAQRLLKEHAGETEPVLSAMFRMVTSRVPTAAEAQVLENLFEQQLALFTQHPDQAKDYLTVGELQIDPQLNPVQLAAMTAVANALLNFDECVVKR